MLLCVRSITNSLDVCLSEVIYYAKEVYKNSTRGQGEGSTENL